MIRVFIDTTALLAGFARARRGMALPTYLSDPDAERWTFEKNVFESYLAFRGIGGKKPDEGRGRWAEANLKDSDDPRAVGAMSSLYHKGDTPQAHFWLNHIESFVGCERAMRFAEAAGDENNTLNDLLHEHSRFDSLCDAFRDFLRDCQIRVLPYQRVFGSLSGRTVSAATLDGLVRTTAIPSEDFEIVFAAMSVNVDIFVTDDERLITSARSLGLNLPLSAGSFCRRFEYDPAVSELKQALPAE